jgi:DNA-binding Lrp family transcriptional regulator
MKPVVDDLDRQIVDLLMVDGRMSCADIARSIGNVSSRAVSYRINRLVEEKIITIRPIVNPAALGYHLSADVFIEAEPQSADEVAETCAAMDEVNYVAITSGDRDVAIQVYAVDVKHLREFIMKSLQTIPGVDHTKTFLLMDVLKDIDSWGIPSRLPHDGTT